jgi:hypothetical protein
MNRFTLSMVVAGVMLSAASAGPASARSGMTWGLYSHDPTLGVDHVGCAGCNAYTGDTACKTKLPILCLNVDGSPRPPYSVTPGQEFYEGWAEGHIATTLPVAGTHLTTPTTGDQICATSFGTGWRMAEHHDGQWVSGMDANDYYYTPAYSPSPWTSATPTSGGWTFYAYGNVVPTTSIQRFWVHVNTTNGNCWGGPP